MRGCTRCYLFKGSGVICLLARLVAACAALNGCTFLELNIGVRHAGVVSEIYWDDGLPVQASAQPASSQAHRGQRVRVTLYEPLPSGEHQIDAVFAPGQWAMKGDLVVIEALANSYHVSNVVQLGCKGDQIPSWYVAYQFEEEDAAGRKATAKIRP